MSRGRTRHRQQNAAATGFELTQIGAAIAASQVDPVLGIVNAPAGADPTSGAHSSLQTGSIYGLTPYYLGAYLNEFYGGNFRNIGPIWDVFENRDDGCAPTKEKRISKVVKEVRKWEVIAIDDSPAAVAHQEYLQRLYNNLRAEKALERYNRGGMAKLATFLLDALGKKYSFCAKIWYRRNGEWRLALKWLPLWYFRIDGEQARFYPNPDTLDSNEVTDQDWIVACRDRAIMEACCVLSLFKRLPMMQLVRVLEKWGIPNVVGETDAKKGSPEWNALYAAVQAYISDMAAVISKNANMRPVETKFQSAALHRPWIDRCDRFIAVNWLGGELGTMAASGTGTLAGGAQANDLDDLVATDCEWLSDCCQEQIDRDAIWRQFRDPEPLAYWSCVKSDDQDDKLTLDVIKAGLNAGVDDIPKGWFHERFRVPVAKAGEPVLELRNPYDALTGSTTGKDGDAAAKGNAGMRRLRARANAGRSALTASTRRDLKQIEANSMDLLQGAEAAIWKPLLQAIGEQPNLTAMEDLVRDWQVPDDAWRGYADAVAQITFAAAMRGAMPARRGIAANARTRPSIWRRIPNALGRVIGRFGAEADVEYGPLPFDEAIAFWSAKQLVSGFEDLEETWLEAVVHGFKVAGITEETILAQLLEDIGAAIAGEMTVDEFIAQAVAKYGLGELHAETVIRTNLQSAFQWAHYQQLTDPAVLEAFPMWGFDVTVDDRTSDVCEPLNGLAYPASDPIWDSLYPPNHYNCRTTVYPLAADEVEKQGFADMSNRGWPVDQTNGAPVVPDQAFSGNIGTVKTLGSMIGGNAITDDRVQERVLTATEEAKRAAEKSGEDA